MHAGNPNSTTDLKRDFAYMDTTWTTFYYEVDANSLLNFTHPSASTSNLVHVRNWIIQIVIPAIFAVGILGNVANLLLLTSRRLYPHRRQATPMERSAITGLKSLSLSDLLFCLVGFPGSFLKNNKPRSSSDGNLALWIAYYLIYKTPLMNIFLFSSTWLIALVCTERYIAVCQPFRAASLIRVRRTVLAHLTVFVVSVLLNIPLFLNVTYKRTPCGDGMFCYFNEYSRYYVTQPALVHAHYVTWFTFGTFVPLSLILGSNAFLVRELHRKSTVQLGGSFCTGSGNERTRAVGHSSEKDSTLRLTLTLIFVVVCFLVLVCPSMLLHFAKYVDDRRPYNPSRLTMNEAFHWAILITNLTQAIKFSSNFILYSIINKTIRQTFTRLLRGGPCGNENERHLQQQNMTRNVKPLSPDAEVVQMNPM